MSLSASSTSLAARSACASRGERRAITILASRITGSTPPVGTEFGEFLLDAEAEIQACENPETLPPSHLRARGGLGTGAVALEREPAYQLAP